MTTYIVQFFSVLLPLLAIDGVWLSIMSKRFYKPYLDHLMAESFKIGPILVFYPIYALAVVIFILEPALRESHSMPRIFFMGLILGFAAYGTYDFTNHAILKNWPTVVTLVDVSWGAILTGAVSVIAVQLTKYFS